MRSKCRIRTERTGFASLIAIAAICLSAAVSSTAQTFWQGASNGNWAVAGNWSNGIVPGNNNENVVNNTAAGIYYGAGSYTISSFNGSNSNAFFELYGGTLAASSPGVSPFSLTGDLLVQGGSTLSGFVVNAGSVKNYGTDTFSNVAFTGATAGNVTNLGVCTLNNVSFSGAPQYISGGATTTIVSGTIALNQSGNVIAISGGGGVDTYMNLAADTTLTGQGSVSLSLASGGGTTLVQGSGLTLTNDATISGAGVIGGGLTLVNNGTINANETGTGLALNAEITNTGTIETTGGFLSVGSGTIQNSGNIQINGAATGGILDLAGTTLQGAGTVTLNSSAGTAGISVDEDFTNNSTIQGSGFIASGVGPDFIFLNNGTINANVSGSTLALNIMTPGNGLVEFVNTGLIEASGGGVLQISTRFGDFFNVGGNITANAAGDTVQLSNVDIIGGTLNNVNGGYLGTLNGGYGVGLNGNANGGLTINGTYTDGLGASTYLYGPMNNQGNIQVNGGAGFTTILAPSSANVTLSGGGTVTLNGEAGAGFAIIEEGLSGATLENFNNTIQGNGIIGYNGLSLQNDAGGTILANVPGGTLLLGAPFAGSFGTVTNYGTFQADAGSTLLLQSTAFTNFSGNTLTGGAYIVNGTPTSPGTLQIDTLGSIGGEIVNNAANIILNGPNSNFVDAAGLDALSKLANNTVAGGFTISGGRNFTTAGDFSNAGTVMIGAGSTMQIGPTGTNNYIQMGGVTTVNGSLVPTAVDLNGGVLAGTGSVTAVNVLAAGGIIAPGTATATGELTINGNLTDTGSALDIRIGGTGAGQYDVLDVNGNVNLGAGSILDISLFDGFTPTNGETFTFLDFTGSLTSQGLPDFFGTVDGLTTPGGSFSISENFDPGLTLTFHANVNPAGTPEPGPAGLVIGMVAVAGAAIRRRKRRK